MFVAEAVLGWVAQFTGLMADSLDMLTDALIYGTALYAVGRGAHIQSRAATASGVIQVALGLGVLGEVVRCFTGASRRVPS